MFSASRYPSLQRKIDLLLPDSLFPPSNLGIKIVSLSKGETLYELNPGMMFNPASNQKLFTAATALSELGEGYQFATQFSIDTTMSVKRLYVKGFGDPVLSTSDLDSIARNLSHILPTGKTWALVGDTSFFDDLHWGLGWTWDDEPDPSAMFISPLSVNGNTISVNVRPGRLRGDPVVVTTDPPTGFVAIENNGRTAADSVTEELKISRTGSSPQGLLNLITIRGELTRRDTAIKETLSLAHPELYTLTLLGERLQSHGVQFVGMSFDTIPAAARTIARYEHRLDSVVTYMDKESDNLSAECILKTLAVKNGGTRGSAERGIPLVKKFLSENGIDTARIAIADGSGVSRYNLVSAAVIVDLLKAMSRISVHFATFYNSLPVAGVDGTLSHRMRGTPAQGNLHAKTGTLNGTSSLSGYVHTADGELIAFSILMQNFPNNTRAYRQVQDQIGTLLSALRRSEM
jgi:D-alanyl-D-alanine carboxypeptidase/D-alanyl-D-alanine-endopeptidase (penicillin-binding protein 4)